MPICFGCQDDLPPSKMLAVYPVPKQKENGHPDSFFFT